MGGLATWGVLIGKTIIPVVILMKIPMKSDRVGYGYMAASGLLTSLFNYLFFAGLSHGQAGYDGGFS